MTTDLQAALEWARSHATPHGQILVAALSQAERDLAAAKANIRANDMLGFKSRSEAAEAQAQALRDERDGLGALLRVEKVRVAEMEASLAKVDAENSRLIKQNSLVMERATAAERTASDLAGKLRDCGLLLERVWRQGDLNPGSQLFDDVCYWFNTTHPTPSAAPPPPVEKPCHPNGYCAHPDHRKKPRPVEKPCHPNGYCAHPDHRKKPRPEETK